MADVVNCISPLHTTSFAHRGVGGRGSTMASRRGQLARRVGYADGDAAWPQYAVVVVEEIGRAHV